MDICARGIANHALVKEHYQRVISSCQLPFSTQEHLQHKYVLRVLEFLSVPTITQRMFFRHQSHYLMPSASRVWEKEKAALIAAAQNRGLPLNLGGDGRADSPGHSAKFGSYSIIDLDQNKVIDVQLVQVCIFVNDV